MTTQLSPLVVQRFFDNNNNPLAGGLLYTYAAGTSTPQATYTDATGSTPNANPVVLNARGEANVWMTAGQSYKFVLQDSLANVIWTVDQINGFITGVGNLGNCRLVKSGANIVLLPYQGNGLAINGLAYAIPSAGVSLAPTSLTPSTLYYIYAYMSGTTMTLEASTTGHSTDVTTGVEIKTGDATRTLVGMARPIAGPLWQDTASQRFVASWFNRKNCALSAQPGATSPTSTSVAAEANVAYRTEFIAWALDGVASNLSGTVTNNTAGSTNNTALRVDGVAILGNVQQNVPAIGAVMAVAACGSYEVPTDSYHYFTMFIAVSGGTGTWNADFFVRASIFA